MQLVRSPTNHEGTNLAHIADTIDTLQKLSSPFGIIFLGPVFEFKVNPKLVHRSNSLVLGIKLLFHGELFSDDVLMYTTPSIILP